MKAKINKKNIGYFICALAGIFSMNPYFVWPTFLNGILTYCTYLLYVVSALYLFFYCSPRHGIRKKSIWGSVLLIIIFVCCYFNNSGDIGLRTLTGACLAYFFLFCLFTRDKDTLQQIYKYFVILFIISVLPGIFYYLLELFGISLSVGTIQSSNQLAYSNSAEYTGGIIGSYKLYIGAVMRVDSNTRMSGIFDEPGLVGTVSALLLCSRGLKLKKDIQSALLLLILLFSFSFAGYLLFILYVVAYLLKNGRWKLCLFILCILIGFIVLINVDLSNTPLAGIQRRFQFTESGIMLINNRQTSTFERGYEAFKNAGFFTKMFGFGYGASSKNPYLIGSSTYKLSIYNTGYFTFFCEIMFFCFGAFETMRKKSVFDNWDKICLLLLFLISIYQRPSVFYAYYFIILFGGIAYIDSSFPSIQWKEHKNITNNY